MATPYNLMGALVDRNMRDGAGDFERGGNAGNKVVLKQDWVVDPTLPRIADHPISREAIVIPRGKLVKVATAALVNTPATISICSATSDIAAGVARVPYLRQSYYSMARPVPAPIRDQQITLPYISAVNDAGGTLTNGKFLMPDANGNCILWDGNDPQVVVGRVDIIDKRNGNHPGWLKWLSTNFEGWEYGLMFDQNTTVTVTRDGAAKSGASAATPVTFTFDGATVTSGTVAAASLYANATNTRYYFSKSRVNMNVRPVDIYVGGPLAAKDDAYGASGFGDGYEYLIDPVKGFVQFTTAIGTAVTVQATYAYEADYVAGASYGQGIPGLTDGAVSGLGAGTDAWADQAGSVGKMLITLRSF